MAPFHCCKLLIKMKCVSFFIVLAISLNLFCLVEATFYQCSTDIQANSNGTDRGVLGKLWVHVGTLVFGCTSINNTSADHVVASRYEDTDVDYQDENEEDQEDQNIGKSVRQVIHHLGITLGNALDSVLFLGIGRSSQDSMGKKNHSKKPVVAKSEYFNTCGLQDECFDCGSPNTAFESNLSRIIWGDAARSHEFPWLASLHKIKYPHVPGKKFNSRSAFCGGTLINDLYVLTAGHCLYKRDTSQFFVVLGKHQRNFDERSPEEEYFDVAKVHIHKRFNYRNNHHDIGLVKLKRRVSFSQSIRPACFPLKETKLDGKSLTIAGWGRTNFSTKVTPRSLLKTQVEVVSNEDCREETLWKTRKRHSIEKHMFCAIGQSAKNGTLVRDACLGDSGGPATETTDSGQHLVQGIVSFGYHCGHKDYPGVYTRVGRYINWVGYRTRDACYCNS